MLTKAFGPGRQQGLSLIELMVALVAGLIVSGAAIALVVAIIKSNAETIRGTRLTQELRTTAEVMARDLRRARGVSDPIANVGLASASLLKNCNTVSPAAGASATCAKYAYDCAADSSGTFTGGQFAAIGLAGNKVRIVTSTTAMPACPTSTTGTQISSDMVKITGLTVSADAATDGYTIRLTGQFANDPSTTNPLVRSVSQEVRIRSAAVN